MARSLQELKDKLYKDFDSVTAYADSLEIKDTSAQATLSTIGQLRTAEAQIVASIIALEYKEEDDAHQKEQKKLKATPKIQPVHVSGFGHRESLTPSMKQKNRR